MRTFPLVAVAVSVAIGWQPDFANADTLYLQGRAGPPLESFSLSSSGNPAVLSADADVGTARATGTVSLTDQTIKVFAMAQQPADAELEASLLLTGLLTGSYNATCASGPCYSFSVLLHLSGTSTDLLGASPGTSEVGLGAFDSDPTTLDGFDSLDLNPGTALRDLMVVATTYGLLNINFGFSLDPSNQIFDYRNTASLELLLPEGVTFTTPNITLTAQPVPEPASLTLLGLGLAGMAGRRWRQRKAS